VSESLDHLPADAPIAGIRAALEAAGAVVLEGLLDPDLLTRFNRELDEHVEATPDGRVLGNPAYEAFFGPHTRHLSAVAARSRVFVEEVLLHPRLLELADAVLLPACASYRLNVAHVLDRGPGSDQQYVHRDEDVWPHVPRPRPVLQLAAVIALEDFTAANGGTRVVPGSHRWEPGRQPAPEQLVAAEMPAGSAVLYYGATLHGGGPNVTEGQRRRGMHLSYLVGWLRTEENNYLTVPIEQVRGFPRRAQELLGYSTHDAIAMAGGACGVVNTRNPIDLLEAGEL